MKKDVKPHNIGAHTFNSGAGKRTRTPNMRITIPLLYQLSYAGLNHHYYN